MENEKKYKLKRIKKAGLAIGLSAIMAVSSITAVGGILQLRYNPTQTTHITVTTQAPAASHSNNSNTNSKPDYIDVLKSNELNVYDEDKSTIDINLNNYNYLNYINLLNSTESPFDTAKYYGLDEALELYNSTEVKKSTNSNLLDENGKLDANKLIECVNKNNEAYMAEGIDAIKTFYKDMSSEDINKMCVLIAEVVNNKFNDVEINKAANTLTKLKIFERSGTAANAYVSNNLTFVFNPNMSNMYADMKSKTDNFDEEETIEGVIIHEIMHLLEYSANDINDDNGIESGICRMYNVPNKDPKLPVDSLWNSWLLEAAAELGMSDYLNIKPGTYAKKISYVKSYNLSRFNELNLEKQGLEDVAFNHTLEKAYKDLELNSKEEQREFLNFLYSIEIIQTNPDDFWKNYTEKTGINLTEEEKTEIRMNIRTDAIKYLTKNFYNNLATAVHEGNVTDIDSVFYLMRNWEIDVHGHLEYTKTNTIEPAKDFIIWQDEIQNEFFSALAESNNLTKEDISTMYDDYNLQVTENNQIYNNCNFDKYNDYTSNYITSAKEKYATTKFSRNKDVANYIRNNNLKSPTTETNGIKK